MSSVGTRAASINTRTGSEQSSRNWSVPALGKIPEFKKALAAASVRMVCRDNPDMPAHGKDKQKGCFGAGGLGEEVDEVAMQPLDKMKIFEHDGKAWLTIWPHGSACKGGKMGQYYPAVVTKVPGKKSWRVVEWKDTAWRAANTFSANQANNIKKAQEKATKDKRPVQKAEKAATK